MKKFNNRSDFILINAPDIIYSDPNFAIAISILAKNGELSEAIHGQMMKEHGVSTNDIEKFINEIMHQDDNRLPKASEVYKP